MVGGRGWARRLVLVLAVFSTLALIGPFAPKDARAQSTPRGFQIIDGRLIDGYGNDFIMRGVNHPHAWFESETGSLADIKAAGANTARIVLSTGSRFSRTGATALAELVQECETVRLVCVLEVHDTTGYPEVAGSISLDEAADYWEEMLPVLAGTEPFILINIGNEPFDNAAMDAWKGDTEDAIQRLRELGYAHTLMVDAPNWGQDWTFTMRDQAGAVFDADPERNVMFDIHMYGVFDDATKVRSYLESFVRRELPLVIGEFGATHTDGDPDEQAIFHWSALYGIGTLAWSWSGNVDPVADLNVVEGFDPERRTAWGDMVLAWSTTVDAEPLEASIFGDPVLRARPLLAPVPPVDKVEALKTSWIKIARIEAEAGAWNGLSMTIAEPGVSGHGYLTGFDTRGDSVTVTANVPRAGFYNLWVGYRSPYGDKLQQVVINGTDRHTAAFPQSDTFRSSMVASVQLRAGENTVMIQHDWGWFDLDYVEVWSDQ